MKLTIIAIACALLMTLTLDGLRPKVRKNTSSVTPQTTMKNVQDVPEWDPEKEGIADLIGAKIWSAEEAKKKNDKKIPIIARFFTPEEFKQYVKDEVVPALKKPAGWKPTFITLHNTAKPTIAQRPNGFSLSNMDGLAHYYGVTQGWWSGPHLFVDQNGIWVFSRLDQSGTHSPCYNAKSWGIEQLGNFDTESYDTGAGAKIRDNAVAAVAILSIAGKITAGPKNKNNPLRFHREDTCTDHVCPGNHCNKNEIISSVAAAKQTWQQKWDTP
jgi:hypothetical protein